MTEYADNPVRSRFKYLVRKAIRENKLLEHHSKIPSPRTSPYVINDDLVAKCIDSHEHFSNEYAFGKFAYENGISVPKIHCADRFRPILSDYIISWFIVMDYIKGEDLTNLDGEDKKDAIRQYRRELRKVANLGIFPGDSGFGVNAIYSTDGRLYLIDFELWKFGTRNELKRVYDAISTPLPRGYSLKVYDWE